MIARTLLSVAAMGMGTRAFACTLCHSQVAEEVRARIFEADFWPNLAMVAAPALILFGAILLAARTPVIDMRAQ